MNSTTPSERQVRDSPDADRVATADHVGEFVGRAGARHQIVIHWLVTLPPRLRDHLVDDVIGRRGHLSGRMTMKKKNQRFGACDYQILFFFFNQPVLSCSVSLASLRT